MEPLSPSTGAAAERDARAPARAWGAPAGLALLCAIAPPEETPGFSAAMKNAQNALDAKDGACSFVAREGAGEAFKPRSD